MKECNKNKLFKFISNGENKMLLVYFFTILFYCLTLFFIKNTWVGLFSYFLYYFGFTKLFNYIEDKVRKSLINKNTIED